LHRYQILVVFCIPACLWIGLGNLIIRDALKRKGLSTLNMLSPYVISKLGAMDFVKLFLLSVITLALALFLGWLVGLPVS
jgi:hypothetical protein